MSTSPEGKWIHLVIPFDWGWVICYAASRLYAGLRERGYKVTQGTEYERAADLNYSLTWHPPSLKSDPPYPTVTLFTHFNSVDPGWQDFQLRIPHHIVTQTHYAKEQLAGNRGISREKITPIYFGNDEFSPPDNLPDIEKIVVCSSGRGYNNGRKRQWLPIDLSWLTDLSRFHFVFFGPPGGGWETVTSSLNNQGISAQFFPDLPFEKEPELLRKVDFYLCTAHSEGGPIGALNAMGCGVPVISPYYGYPADFGAYAYYDSVESLAEIFSSIANLSRPLPRRNPVRTSWEENWVNGHSRLFESLWEECRQN